MKTDFDILIAGGGLAGSTLACALAAMQLRIGIIEAVEPAAETQPSFDDRAIALAYGSQKIFAGIGLWEAMQPSATPIHQIHISEQGRFGFTHLDAHEELVPALGYVALARDLGQSLLEKLHQTCVTRLCPATLSSFNVTEKDIQITIHTAGEAQQLSTQLLIAADGGKSGIREQLGIKTRKWDYAHSAIVTNVLPSKEHGNIAYERFGPHGPLALLPMSDNRFGVVYTTLTDKSDDIMALNDTAFLKLLQQRIGFRAGRLQKVGKRTAYPLSLITAKESVRPRIALLGNAAHTLHPIAGQGFNLGLRDIAVLVDVLTDAVTNAQDVGSLNVLKRYAEQRQRDQHSMALITDGMARLFSNPLESLALGRNLGLLAADLIPGIRHHIAEHAMGLKGPQPRLTRGVSLE